MGRRILWRGAQGGACRARTEGFGARVFLRVRYLGIRNCRIVCLSITKICKEGTAQSVNTERSKKIIKGHFITTGPKTGRQRPIQTPKKLFTESSNMKNQISTKF